MLFRTRYLPALAVALALASTFTACGKKDEPKADEVQQLASGQQGDDFSGPQRQETLRKLEESYGLRIVQDANDYAAEYRNNRILRYLGRNQDQLKDRLKNVVELHLGSAFASQELTHGKFVLTLDTSASLAEILRFLDENNDAILIANVLKQLGSKSGIAQIDDLKGMSEAEANAFSDNLISAARGFDFSVPYAAKLMKSLKIDTLFAVGAGELIVPYDASAEKLHAFIADAMELSRHLDSDLAALSSLVGVTVGYQPGVLTPADIVAGMRVIEAQAKLFKVPGAVRKAILIGRRSESDAFTAKRADSLLISFHATADEIKSTIALLGKNIADLVAQTANSAVQAYALSGITLTVRTPDTTTVSDEEASRAVATLQSALDALQGVARPSRLTALGVKSVRDADVGVPSIDSGWDSGTTLSVNLKSLDPRQLESVLGAFETQQSVKQRIALQKQLLDSLRSQGGYSSASIAFDYADDRLDGSSADKTQAVQQLSVFFQQVAKAERLTKDKIDTVYFFKGSLSVAESAVIIRGTLQIDPYRATSAVLESVLKQQEAALAPAPSPSPKPVK